MMPARTEAFASEESDPYLTRAEAAEYLRLKPRTLANLASRGVGPRYYRASGRTLYRASDLTAWVEGLDGGRR